MTNKFVITRPLDGIALNAGYTEALLDDNGNLAYFSMKDAIELCHIHGLDTDGIIPAIEFNAEYEEEEWQKHLIIINS